MNVNTGHEPHEQPDLTPKQAKLIELLIAGSTVVKAATALGVNESTCRRWLKLPAVASVYSAAKNDLVNQVLSMLHKQGLNALQRHITAEIEPTAASQIAAIKLVNDEMRLNGELQEIRAMMEEFKDELARGGYE